MNRRRVPVLHRLRHPRRHGLAQSRLKAVLLRKICAHPLHQLQLGFTVVEFVSSDYQEGMIANVINDLVHLGISLLPALAKLVLESIEQAAVEQLVQVGHLHFVLLEGLDQAAAAAGAAVVQDLAVESNVLGVDEGGVF